VPKCNPPAIDKLRPISLLCIPNKILETVVINSLKDQIIADLPDYQFAYKKHSSSTTALIDMHNKVTNSLEKSEVAGVIIISFDFAKAFDKIPHTKLIDRLISLDYPKNFILWIASYLQNRSQCVKINQTRSDSIEISSGVPQGSVLGPFLFMLYLSSYKPYYNSSYPVIFADDTYIIIEILKNANSDSIVCDEIANMKKWSDTHFMPLNDHKMEFVFFGKKGCSSDIFSEPVICNNLVDHIKILGVEWSEKLSWQNHFNKIITKCNARLHAINVTKRLLNHDELWILFHSTIVSLLEYAAPLFGRLESGILQDIRTLYKRCSRMVCRRNCDCNNVPMDLQSFRDRLGLRLLENAEKILVHPLHKLIPMRHQHTKSFIIQYCKTNRFKNSFAQYYVLLASNLLP
jgi:hypothetical protein